LGIPFCWVQKIGTGKDGGVVHSKDECYTAKMEEEFGYTAIMNCLKSAKFFKEN
jgi:hypothetical protein